MNLLAQLIFLLVAAHALADFPLQGHEMANAKRPGGSACIPWYMALGCHAAIHGFFVAVITGALTGAWWLGPIETASHAAIDGAKCRGWFGMKVDQGLHLGCKLAWAVIAWSVPR